MTAATTITPTPKQIRRQQRQSSPTYSDFVVFNNNKDAMMNTTTNTVIDTTPLEDTDEWTSFNHPTDWKVSSSTKSIATVKTADDDEWTLFDDQSTFNTAMGNDIVDKTTIIMSTIKSSSSSVNNDGSTIGGGGSTTGNSTTQRSVTTPSYTEKEYDIDTLVRIKQQAASQLQQSKHTRSTSSSSQAAASAAASVGCGSKASIQSILRKSSYSQAGSKSKASGSVTFDSVKSKTSTFMEELQTTCGQYFCSRGSRGSGTVGINDILTGKCHDLLLTKEERKVDIDYTFLGKVISCATKMNGCVPFDECGGCGSVGEMNDEDTAVSTLTEIRWSDDVVKK